MNSSVMPTLTVAVNGVPQSVPFGPRVTVGRTPDNDVVIAQPQVSRHHLALELRGGVWHAVDAGSTNGFFVGGQRVRGYPISGPLTLRLGDPVNGPVVEVGVMAPTTIPPAPGAQPGQAPSRPSPVPPPVRPKAQAAPPSRQQPAQRPPTGRLIQPIGVRQFTLPEGGADLPHLQAMRQNLSAVYQVAGSGPGAGPASPASPPVRDSIPVSAASAMRIGRTPDNDIVIHDVLASRHHAQVTQTAGVLVIEDLRSSNGTFVNGRRITRQQLSDGDVVTIGNSDFVVAGGTLVRGQEKEAVAGGVNVYGVSLTIDNKKLLNDVDFAAGPGSLTAIIGPSGAGKSTVSRVISGTTAPTEGAVTFEGRDVHAEYQALRTRIGMVPQDDVLHGRLTLQQALRYAAQLRLPPDMSRADRDTVIDGVLAELQLAEHKSTRVDKLSGGQRKRASVAMELLTGPSLLLLDEPTSGLDPALDRQVMQTLRRLADAGRVVIVVTHSVSYLAMCDQVLMLAPGGKTAFCGPPDHVKAALGTDDWAEIFAYAAAQPDQAWERYRSRSRRQTPPHPNAVQPERARPKQASFTRQAGTVARRQIRLIFADKGYLGFLLALPVVIGLLSMAIPGKVGLRVQRQLTDPMSTQTLQILVVLVVGVVFMGSALTVRDLVGERAIFHRERAVGLRPGAYLLAKLLVFGVALVVQIVILMAVTYAGQGTPPSKGVLMPSIIELPLDLVFVGMVGVLLGLLISAVVRTSEQTMPPLVVIVMVQLVMCGGMFGLHGRAGVEQFAWFIPSRWGYAAAASTIDVKDYMTSVSLVTKEPLWKHDVTAIATAYGVLAVMAIVLWFLVYRRLRLKVARR